MASLFHSKLRDMTRSGPVEARVESDVTESKFKKGTYYVKLRIDRQTYDYTCDTQDIEEAFDGLKGSTVEIEAGGTRDNPTIDVREIEGKGDDEPAPRGRRGGGRRTESRREDRDDDRGREERAPARERRKPAPKQEPPARKRMTPEEVEELRMNEMRLAHAHAMKFCTLMLSATSIVVDRLVPVYEAMGYSPTSEDVRALSNTLAIEMKSYADVHKLPLRHPQEEELCGREVPERQPDPEPDRRETRTREGDQTTRHDAAAEDQRNAGYGAPAGEEQREPARNYGPGAQSTDLDSMGEDDIPF